MVRETGGATAGGTARPVVLTIAGSDSGGGAGIQADLRTIHAHGGFATSALTCVTAQNLGGVSSVTALGASAVGAQIEAVLEGFRVRAVKTGMLFSAEIIEAVAAVARRPGFPPLVVDPVMVATSGDPLLQPDAIATYRDTLLPRATVITPNLDEAAVLLGWQVQTEAAMDAAARELGERVGTAVFLKGGHLGGDPVDVLWTAGRLHRWRASRVQGVNSHGSGCTLSAAIASRLARGENLVEACAGGHRYMQASFRNPVRLEDGVLVLGVAGEGEG